ncbi:MAG: hypothetical protein NTX22_15280 [Ignavibacteriales bacterium]|nr:hypothetical protein [Ignavibacteriales bacterium]
MKKLFIFILLIISIPLLANGEPERILEKGNTFYQNNQFEQAIEVYEKILHNGYESKNLYYNLGNANFRIGRIGYSILNYEKALKLSPNDEDINYNLKIANAHTVDKIEMLPKLFFVRWWESLVNLFPINGWLITIYFIYLIILSIAALYFFSKSSFIQRWSFLTGSIFGILFLLSLLFFFLKLNQDTNSNYAILIESTVTVKTSPDNQSNDAFIIHEGLKVKVEDELNNWYKVRLADGKIGWLPEANLKII